MQHSFKTMTPPILLIITSKNCPHCRLLDTIKQDMMDALKELYPELEEETIIMSADPTSLNIKIYNIGLRNYIRTFPMFFLIDGDEWIESKKNTRKPFDFTKIEVYGKIWKKINGRIQYIPTVYPSNFSDFTSLQRWLKNSLKKFEIPFNGEHETDTNSTPESEVSIIKPSFSVHGEKITNMNSQECPCIKINYRKLY